MNEGPKKLTIEEYLKRNQRRKDKPAAEVPVVKKPKRRGGKYQKLKRELAIIKRLIDGITSETPYGRSCELWEHRSNVEFLMRQDRERRKNIR